MPQEGGGQFPDALGGGQFLVFCDHCGISTQHVFSQSRDIILASSNFVSKSPYIGTYIWNYIMLYSFY